MSDRGPTRRAVRIDVPSDHEEGSSSSDWQSSNAAIPSTGAGRRPEQGFDSGTSSDSDSSDDYDEVADRLSDEDFDPSTATDEEYSNVSRRAPRFAPHRVMRPPRAPSPPRGPRHGIEPEGFIHRRPHQHHAVVPLPHNRVYEQPFRVEDPSSSLAAVVSLRGISTRPRMPGTHQLAAQSWEVTKGTLPTGAKTDCLTVREVSHYADEAGDSLITLICYDAASSTKKESVQTRWMHLYQDPNLADFEDIIDACPHADQALKTVALALLRDRRHSANTERFQGESGSRDFITRYDYRDHRGTWSTESVIFMSVPFFTTKTRAWLVQNDMTPTSATPVRYHLHTDHEFAAADAQMASGGSFTTGSGTDSEVCVAYLWCLLLGPDIIITCGDIEFKDLLVSSITVEMKSDANRRPCVIRITDSDSRYFHLVIDPPLSYFEFMESVVNKVRVFSDGTRVANFKLLTEDLDELTPEIWLGFMQRDDLDSLSLILRRTGRVAYTSMSESEGFSDESSSLQHLRNHSPGASATGVVINDLGALSRARSRVFQATIESDDSESETTRSMPETTSRKSDGKSATSGAESTSNPLPQSVKPRRTANQRVRKVGFADETILPSQSTSTGSTAYANGDCDAAVPVTIHPFFTWNVMHKRGSDGNLPPHIQICRLLSRVDKAMARKRPTAHRYVYQRGYECDPSGLGHRHPCLTGTSKGTSATSLIPEAEKANMPVDGISRWPTLEQVFDAESRGVQDPLLWENVVEQYCRPLVTISLEIGERFVPADLEVVHRCWKKLWGALDRILRCVEMHYKQPHGRGTYRASERLYAASPYFGSGEEAFEGVDQCQACKEGTEYQSVGQALDHLHERHAQCQGCSKPTRVFDDPCTVWIEGNMEIHDRKVQKSLSRALRKLSVFILYLEDIRRCISELHRSVQHIDAPGGRKAGKKKLPLLPSTLVRGFEELLLSYITLAHILSRATTGGETEQAPPTQKVPRMRGMKTGDFSVGQSRHGDSRSSRTYGSSHVPSSYATHGSGHSTNFEVPQIHRQSMVQAKLRFKHARRDLILLSTTTSQAGSVSLTAVGAEYILGVVLAGLNTHMDGKKEHLLGMYNRQLVRVANQAARRPQRRHFMELHALETNLLAVRRVFRLHHNMLINYERILDPHSYRVTTKARQALFEVEAKLLGDEAKRLTARLDFGDGLFNRLAFFQQRIKQQIEVLEEGHGKAIRVFTFVTAFFLPL
ncbi:hypothetical protein JDV02_004327 [Purpureocillium takamizusanense]|nr:uncharacterized protein JDV02_004327 [Purpureocillium takamizusanense]UNI18030.1 hypothetical protein JDV02_004327 [Purpureocillium takamizusanense]